MKARWISWNQFEAVAILALLLLSANLVIPFYIAYFSGTEVITFHINRFGEANIEAVLFLVMWLMGLITFIRKIKSKQGQRKGGNCL